MRTLDAWLPSFSVRERHEITLECRPEETLEAALAISVTPDWVVRALFRLRGLGTPTQSLGEFSSSHGFIELERTATTYVFGLAARLRGHPRQARDRDEWMSWTAPGIKIATDFCAEDLGGGRSRLSTETRVLALDRSSQALFRIYWLVVGPFSALIRRRWLRAIAARASDR